MTLKRGGPASIGCSVRIALCEQCRVPIADRSNSIKASAHEMLPSRRVSEADHGCHSASSAAAFGERDCRYAVGCYRT